MTAALPSRAPLANFESKSPVVALPCITVATWLPPPGEERTRWTVRP